MTARITRIDPDNTVDDDIDEDTATLSRGFTVYTDSPEPISVLDVIDFDGRFRPGFRFSPTWKVNNVQLRESESNTIYRLSVEFVLVDYKTPFFVPIEWTWESATLEIPAYSDTKGRPCVSTAGEPITGLTRPVKLWVIRGVKNVPGVPRWFKDYGVSTNSDIVTLDGEKFKPWDLQLQRLSLGGFESQTIGKTEYRYRPLTFEFWFNPLSWRTEVLNMGSLELFAQEGINPLTGQTTYTYFQVRATNGDGEATPGRVFLDRYGQRPRDSDGNVKTTILPSEIITLKFDLLDPLPYSKVLK